MGASWTHRNSFGRNALMKASAVGKTKVMRVLLDRRPDGIDLFIKDNTDRTALDWSRISRVPEASKMMEEEVANEIDKRRRAAFAKERMEEATNLLLLASEETQSMLEAINSNDLEKIRYCTENLRVSKEEFYVTLEFINKNIQQVNDKNKTVYSLNVESSQGWTALTRAAVVNDDNLIELLITKGADVNSETLLHHTALTWAATVGHEESVRALLILGAEISPTKSEGKTALMHACYNGKAEIVDILLDTIAQRAFESRRQQIENALMMRTEIEGATALKSDWVVFYESMIYCKDSTGNDALHYARRRCHHHCVDLMENSVERALARRATLEAEAAAAKTFPCSMGCGVYIRADENERHQTHLCGMRLITCTNDCGVVIFNICLIVISTKLTFKF